MKNVNIKELIEFIDRIPINYANENGYAVTFMAYPGDVSVIKKIRDTLLECEWIIEGAPDDDLVEKILDIGMDYGRFYEVVDGNDTDEAEEKALMKIRKILQGEK